MTREDSRKPMWLRSGTCTRRTWLTIIGATYPGISSDAWVHSPGEIADHRNGCRNKEQALAGDGVTEDSRPPKIREQPQRECGQIHTKDHEEFSSEKISPGSSETCLKTSDKSRDGSLTPDMLCGS